MSSGDSPPSANVATAQELEALFRETEALKAALAGARRVRLLLLLMTLVLLVAVAGAFFQLGNQVLSDENKDRLLRIAEKRLNEKQDVYLGHLQRLVKNTSPKLTQAFYDQAVKDMPAYLKGMEQERDKLAQNLQVKLEQRLDTHYAKVLSGHEKLLKEEFPLVKDEELHKRMTANTQIAVDRLIKKYYLDEMNAQIVALYDGWDKFPLADPPAKNDPPLEDQFVAYLLELLKYRLSHTDTVARR